jgi:N-acetylmuramic acid 6-phosphate etherase
MAGNKLKATEQRNPRTRGLDEKSTLEIVRAIHREDASVARAVTAALPAITRAVDAITNVLRQDGRLFYVGAGTSGRLAALDAAEIPPTFGTPAHMVQAVIAGGHRALTHAAEGAEDDREQGARDLEAVELSSNDAVVGITASGSTPYVLGALEFARRRGALTISVTSNPGSPVSKIAKIAVVTPTGPEVITGSTRMKAGTSQKLVLNMLSTAAMVRLGRVYDNWMMGVSLTNEKLQARGLRILMEASGATVDDATRALGQAGHNMGVAIVMLKTGINARDAQTRLRAAKGNISAAISGPKLASKGKKRSHG